MPVKSQDLLELAVELAGSASETKQRAAISRAYYAAYHRCKNWERTLPQRGDPHQAKGSHESLISRLRHPNPVCPVAIAHCSRQVGDELEIQRRNRVHADYKIKLRVPRQMLEEQLELAFKVLEQCDLSERRQLGRRARLR